jgi:hypothetical protein
MGAGHVPLTSYRVSKHADAYRAHLIDVLLHQDEETAAVLRKNDEIERYLASELEPAVASQREELARLRARLESIQSIRDLDSALRATSAEVTALRTSMSWRITGPLRAVYGRWLRWRGSE